MVCGLVLLLEPGNGAWPLAVAVVAIEILLSFVFTVHLGRGPVEWVQRGLIWLSDLPSLLRRRSGRREATVPSEPEG
ncbi:putative membrane protein YeiB [Amycolatopsis thermophila]|uniref:Membrane protein YeiB n=1 Tax=Amycolatopsis thermophila TaxID=206084 RepID=A0ABU0F5W7_9PSEU|nr:putative membrane protein YeiB [Amycolatopsis thermophila]